MYKHILVPVALDHERDWPAAMKIARALLADGGKIEILNVMEDIPGYVSAQLPEGILEQNRAEAEAALAALAASSGPGVEANVVWGHAGRSILDHAAAKGVDLIVIASHRPEFEDYLLGSTASRVVRHAPCAVHVMR